MDERPDLNELLRTAQGDAGCAAATGVLEAYVELELAGKDPARAYPGTGIHLEHCPSCHNDHDGLVEAVRLLTREIS